MCRHVWVIETKQGFLDAASAHANGVFYTKDLRKARGYHTRKAARDKNKQLALKGTVSKVNLLLDW